MYTLWLNKRELYSEPIRAFSAWSAAFAKSRCAIDSCHSCHKDPFLKDNKVLGIFAEGNRQKCKLGVNFIVVQHQLLRTVIVLACCLYHWFETSDMDVIKWLIIGN